ncbi:MAG TPA: aromatic-ring-hydroxylating dioxygenase subunit beta [Stellaceae bacterium]|nr:aromatic-ring-hydroxylating dioxygenase subunit beta [Stellaceae bacterium]
MTTPEIEQFLYREALLMDEHRYEEWLSLWTEDGIYWVPCSREPTDPTREVSIIYDDRSKLADRAAYLETGTVREPDSRPLMRRVISSIATKPVSDLETEVTSNFILVEARDGGQFIWCGQSIHRLRRDGGDLKIAFKKVLLVNRSQPMPVLQFLI